MGREEETRSLGNINSYRDLLIWQVAIDIAVACYEATKSLPPSELYGLTSQIRRAATSIPANIAGGYGRKSRAAFIQFLRIAHGSLKELETHLFLATKLDLLVDDVSGAILYRTDELGRMLRGMNRSLQRKR